MIPRLSNPWATGLKGISLVAGTAFVIAALAGDPQPAGAAGPFVSFGGNWSGTGTLTDSTGASERLRCRASYVVGSGGDTLNQDMRCASDSYRFDLQSQVRHQSGSVSGSWSELSRGVHGFLNGRYSGGQITVLAEGTGFSATISVATRGSQQTVTITSPGSEVRRVAVSMKRSGG